MVTNNTFITVNRDILDHKSAWYWGRIDPLLFRIKDLQGPDTRFLPENCKTLKKLNERTEYA